MPRRLAIILRTARGARTLPCRVLFVPQSCHGSNPDGAAGGDQGSDERHDGQDQRHANEGHGIACVDAVEHAGHEPREPERGGEPDGQAGQNGAMAWATTTFNTSA